MKYIFEINIFTDGDFGLPFVPAGMKYDGEYNYSFRKEYTNRNLYRKEHQWQHEKLPPEKSQK